MKLPFVAFLVGIAVGIQVVGSVQAPVTITAKSYSSLIQGVERLSEAARPGSSATVIEGFEQRLGLSELPGVDRERPWQVAVWLEGLSTPPSVSVRVPVTDFAAFRDGLKSGNLLGGEAKDYPVERVGDYASIWVAQPSAGTSESVHSEWSRGKVGTVDDLLEIEVLLPDGLRQELVQTLGMGRMILTGALSGQTSGQLQGMDPQALVDVMGLYFDVADLVIKGLGPMSFRLDVDDQALVLRERCSATSGSELAEWLKGGGVNLQDADQMPIGDGVASMALGLGASPAFMSVFKKLTNMGMRMQGVPEDGEAAELTDKLFGMLTPLVFSGSMDLREGIGFVGSYKFPGRDPSEPYGVMKTFLRDAMQGMVGEEKTYRSIVFDEGDREVAGTRIDRLTMEMNLDLPMYQAPGQKEMIESMWPGGKLVFDYAVKGERLLVGTPARLDPMLKGEIKKVDSEGAGWTKNTVAFGRVNVLKVIPVFLAANPMVPDEVKQQFAGMNTEDGDVTVRVDLDGSFAAETVIPLGVLGAIGGAMGVGSSEALETQ